MERSIEHSVFTINRVIHAPVAKVFAEWSHPERWDVPSEGSWDVYERHEFQPGGQRVQTFGPRNGPKWREEGRYEDIATGNRIVYSYAILRGEIRVSVSLQTL